MQINPGQRTHEFPTEPFKTPRPLTCFSYSNKLQANEFILLKFLPLLEAYPLESAQ